jgi:hypothetical protein
VRHVLVLLAWLACCPLAFGMRLHSVPEYADLAIDQAVDLDGRSCVARRGSVVQVLGTTTTLEHPGTDMLLVRVHSGPCAGGRVTLDAHLLLDVRATPQPTRRDRR